ncbi:hypothetical protein [uncultured Draconibacterium sp.]|uniref:hypothetical protein n=1 Tax=uncultured Draconibacterium sp. TaxID=1573823 RepID=UPI0029C681FC|nr:hypothetical protein [uncultured Draconibacterium sp.]
MKSENTNQSNNTIGENCKIYNAEVKNCILGHNVTIGDSSNVLKTKLESNISINRRNYIFRSNIGKFTYTGIGTMIRSSIVGNFCSISWNVSIGGGNHPHDKVTTSTLNRFHLLDSGHWNNESKKQLELTFKNQKHCLIGNDVLISSNAIILRDIKIGNGAIIGAGAVVTKDVEPYSIIAGVPAKKIKMRFDDRTIERLEKISWWDWPIDTIRENLDLIYSQKVDDTVLEKLEVIAHTL